MAYPITSLSILQVVFEGKHDGQQVISVMSYIYDDLTTKPDGRAEIVSVLSQVMAPDGLYEKYIACVSVDVSDIRCYGQFITPIRYAYVRAVGDGVSGANAGPCLPSNTAQVVSRRGDLADRANISDIHLPGVPVGAVISSELTGPQLTLLQSFGTASVQPYVSATGGNYQPVAFHRESPVLSRKLTESFPQDTVRVMRRRTVGLGA